MVPIHGHAGGIVAFIGRAAPAAPAGCPKDLNTPTTGLYRKADTLFGLHEQLDVLRAGATPVIVEGPLDVLATNPIRQTTSQQLAAVSPCGTALTPAHAAALAAVSDRSRGVILALDDDPAGRVAAGRAAGILQAYGGPRRPHP